MTVQTAQDVIAGPSNAQIMDVFTKGSLSEQQLCDRLRELFLPIEVMEQQIFEVNDANGWFEDDRTVGDDIALLHSEVTEMFEAYRDHGFADVTGTPCDTDSDGVHLHGAQPCKPLGFGSECADVLIRLLDTCRRYGIDLRAEYVRKNAFNATRGHKHGGKRI